MKTKALIINGKADNRVFVFAYADCWFSHAAAQILHEFFIKAFKQDKWCSLSHNFVCFSEIRLIAVKEIIIFTDL